MPKCERCGAEIKFIELQSGKYMPVEAEPVDYYEWWNDGGEYVIKSNGEKLNGGI